MSTEIIDEGNPFLIKLLSRVFGGRQSDIFKVSTDEGVKVGARKVIGTPTVSRTTGSASCTATLQLYDCAGNALQEVRRVFAWVSATAGATSVGTSTTGLTTSVSTGVAITAVAGNLSVDALTDSTGKLVITLADAAGAETRYVNFSVDGKIYSSAAIVTA